MSIKSFVQHGDFSRLLGTKDAAPAYPGAVIQLYDIGEAEFVGAEYPDGARQAQPLEWQSKEVKEALSHPVVRPKLVPRSKNTRPILKRR